MKTRCQEGMLRTGSSGGVVPSVASLGPLVGEYICAKFVVLAKIAVPVSLIPTPTTRSEACGSGTISGSCLIRRHARRVTRISLHKLVGNLPRYSAHWICPHTIRASSCPWNAKSRSPNPSLPATEALENPPNMRADSHDA